MSIEERALILNQLEYITSGSTFDHTILENAVDYIPSWRMIPHYDTPYYVIGLVEDRYDMYWLGLEPESYKLRYVTACAGIGKEIPEWSDPKVTMAVYKAKKMDEYHPNIMEEINNIEEKVIYCKIFPDTKNEL